MPERVQVGCQGRGGRDLGRIFYCMNDTDSSEDFSIEYKVGFRPILGRFASEVGSAAGFATRGGDGVQIPGQLQVGMGIALTSGRKWGGKPVPPLKSGCECRVFATLLPFWRGFLISRRFPCLRVVQDGAEMPVLGQRPPHP